MFEELDNLYAKLQSIRPLSHESVRRLSEDFMIDYTYNSNAIEGSTLTNNHPKDFYGWNKK